MKKWICVLLVLTLALTTALLAVCVTVLTLPELRQYPELVANQLAPSTIFAFHAYFSIIVTAFLDLL